MSDTRDDRFLTPSERRAKEAEEARARNDDFNEEMRVVLSQDASGDDNQPLQTKNGKPVRRQGRKPTRDNGSPLKNSSVTDAFLEGLNYLPEAVKVTKEIFKAGTSILTKTFGPKADIVLPEKYDDGKFVYDMTPVPDLVFRDLLMESEILATKLRELEAIKDPTLRTTFERQIEITAANFEMRLHPDTRVKHYVHSYNRALRIEDEYKLKGIELGEKKHLICLFQLRSEAGAVRGIRAQIADVCETDNVAETRTSGQHLDAKAKGANPAPSLTLH